LVKQHLDVLLPVITSVVNLSLTEGLVAALLKSAIINPLIKKSSLDHNIFKNYRPVSNLPFISKVLERIVAKQLNDYMSRHHLRTQRVHVEGALSDHQLLNYGVPQGSVLGPLLFLIYMLPVGPIINKYGLEMHTYADDTQIYVSVCPTSDHGVLHAVSKLEQCVCEIQEWMETNFLKLNAEKTEVIVLGVRAQLAKFQLHFIDIAGVNIPVQSNAVRNLGVMFDRGMTMSSQVNNITKSANYQLVNIGRVRKMLTTEATKLAVHTLVTSRLDYCNSLLTGICDTQCKRLQNIQRTAARLVIRKRKFDSITSDLIDLHWLPIRQRIDFKV